MLSVVMVVCLGIAGDDWSYSAFNVRHGVSRTVAEPVRMAGAPSPFAPRPVARFVGHTDALAPPADATTPSVVAQGKPAVRPQPPRKAVAKEACRRCGTNCGCGDACMCDPCQCDSTQHVAGGPKQWWTLPEDPSVEGYGAVVNQGGAIILKYERLRPKQVVPPQLVPQPPVIVPTMPITYYNPVVAPLMTGTPRFCLSQRG